MIAAALILGGVLLSAFFSGSETGFYRVTRVRLLLDAKAGSWLARGLMVLISRPALVVATVLIGNNLANYLVSLGLVLTSQSLLVGVDESLRTMLPVLATPLLFIYGELLPKYMYFNAPYLLSMRGAPLMLICAVLFLPLSVLVMGLEWLLHRMLGNEPARSTFSLERQELQRVMLEGQEAGILQPIQHAIAQNLFTYGEKPVRQFAVPLRALPLVKITDSAEEIRAAARRAKQKYLGVLGQSGKELIGCYRVAELLVMSESDRVFPIPVLRVSAEASAIHVLTQLQAQPSPVAQLVDQRGSTLGVVSRDRLISLLLPSP